MVCPGCRPTQDSDVCLLTSEYSLPIQSCRIKLVTIPGTSELHQTSSQKPILEVSCAILERFDQVLVAKRARGTAHGGLWEFPGGKLEENESAAESLVRELKEELGVQIRLVQTLKPSDTEEEKRILRLHPFRCTLVSGNPKPHEHSQIRWVHRTRLETFNWAPADIPVLRYFLALKR